MRNRKRNSRAFVLSCRRLPILSAGKGFLKLAVMLYFPNSLFRGHSIKQVLRPYTSVYDFVIPDGAGWTRESTTWTDLSYGVAVFYLNGNVHSPFSHLPCFSVSSDPALCCVFL